MSVLLCLGVRMRSGVYGSVCVCVCVFVGLLLLNYK